MNPEESACIQIDKLLTQCGWTVQDYTSLDLSASRGVALREVPLKKGRCDYLLLVDCKPVGIVEAKPEGTTLSGVADQSAYYGDNLPKIFQAQGRNYESAKVLLQRILTERREKWNRCEKYKELVAPDVVDLPELSEGWGLGEFATVGVNCWRINKKS